MIFPRSDFYNFFLGCHVFWSREILRVARRFRWNFAEFFWSKRSILVKKPAGWKKFSNFKCNVLSSASLREAGFFSSQSTWPGLSEMIRHIGVPGRAVLWERFLKHPNIQLKNCKVALISPYHHFSPLGKIFHFMRIFF
jgi:hypothetical protein